jgi:CRISPR-associated protein Cas1
MEEFRSFLADRLVLSLVNRRQARGRMFSRSSGGAVMMDDDTRKTVLTAWQKRKQEDILHPYLNEKVKIGLLPHIQSKLMARFLRGDMDGYPPFIWK